MRQASDGQRAVVGGDPGGGAVAASAGGLLRGLVRIWISAPSSEPDCRSGGGGASGSVAADLPRQKEKRPRRCRQAGQAAASGNGAAGACAACGCAAVAGVDRVSPEASGQTDGGE